MTQTSKPFYGLTKNARGTKNVALIRYRKFITRVHRKSKGLCYHRWLRMVYCIVSSFSREHEMPPVKDPLIYDTMQVPQELDFSSTNKTTNVEKTKAPCWLGPPIVGTVGKREASRKARLKPWLLTNRLQLLRIPVYLTVWLPNARRYMHLPDGGDYREYSHWS